ncbi:MAG: hypothetical protein AAF799_11790 [Myxococcota bacterium]
MHLPSLFRFLALLLLLMPLASLGCKAKSSPTSPPGYGYETERSVDTVSSDRLATRGDSRDSHDYEYDYGDAAGAYPAEAPETESTAAYDYDDGPALSSESTRTRARKRTSNRQTRTARRHRPGLGTSYGERHHSRVTTAPFVRGSTSPDVTLALWYNNADGIAQAQGNHGYHLDQLSRSSTTDGVFVASVVDEYGYSMSAAQVGGQRYVLGEEGQRYKLQITNNSGYRYEVVASVDGLDVIDGQTASFNKRGYIIEPWGTITIDGWRTSDSSIAAFRFSGMEDSYAERKGQGRNIGVVGFAFFHERGGVPWQELQRRHDADPFPGRYAEPPPRRRWR